MWENGWTGTKRTVRNNELSVSSLCPQSTVRFFFFFFFLSYLNGGRDSNKQNSYLKSQPCLFTQPPTPREVSMKDRLLTLWTNNVSFYGRFGKSNPRRQMPCYYKAIDFFHKWRSMYYSLRLLINLNWYQLLLNFAHADDVRRGNNHGYNLSGAIYDKGLYFHHTISSWLVKLFTCMVTKWVSVSSVFEQDTHSLVWS